MEENGSQINANAGNSTGNDNIVADANTQTVNNGGAPEGDQKGTDAGQTNGDQKAEGEGEHESTVPYERFKEVNDKLNEFTTLLESAKTDPESKRQLSEMLGVEAKQPAPTPEPAPFQDFLAKSVDPQMHAHYQEFAGAIATEMKKYVKETLAPIMAYIGQTSLEGAYQKNPLLKDYQKELSDVFRRHPTLSPEEAGWHIPALRERMIKAATMSGKNRELDRQSKINKTPVTNSTGAPGGTPRPAPNTTKEMVEAAWNKLQQAPQ